MTVQAQRLQAQLAAVEEIVGPLSMIREEIAKKDLPAHSCAFLGGSITDGFANKNSDVDIYLLVDNDEEAAQGEPGTMLKDGRFWQFYFLSKSMLDDFRRKIANNTVASLVEDERVTLHRILTGVAISGEDRLITVRQELDETRLHYLLSATSFDFSGGMHNDCLGMKAADTLGYLQSVRIGYDCIADSILNLWGDTVARQKWRLRRLQRTFGDGPFLEAYLSVLCGPHDRSPDGMGRYIDYSMRLWQFMFAEAILGYLAGRDLPSTMEGARRDINDGAAALAESLASPSRHPCRHPDYRLERYGEDGFVSARAQAEKKLSPLLAAIWCAMDGRRDPEAVVEFLRRRVPKLAGSLTVETVNKAEGMLRAAGVLA
ncbi:hypothetical protein ASD44_17305 [Mesorhizobium sp. Root554]|uniref:hypothetical protein n=1 Tax=unclassified Mesorhizobium TaxID=325217 RepID=UPI0007006284|nr:MULTISPECIES: hypothetical protein [unclassified Mesorhizobium]KQZ15611.1 hypothetical protein ASD27_17310 [Mesorhizobium sp. Root1471]KQZ38119.1 hypothetical protein ASD44_17305 [Mesorhizobium sp. Root554]